MGRVTAGFVAVVLLLAGCSSSLKSSGGSSGGDDNKYAAFSVCEKFVRERLKAPGDATFRDPYADNGDTTFSGSGDTWTINSSVDAENSFGAKLRSTFTCSVHHTSGDTWALDDININDAG